MARGEEIRVADAQDEEALAAAFEGATVVASCAGPFLELGHAPVAAAIRAGAHYLDTSGEQAYARIVYEQYGPEAERRGVVLLTSFGFDYVPGDLAARLAADGLEPLHEIAVAYSVSGTKSSRGTRRSMAQIMRQPLVAWSGGQLVPSRFAATSRKMTFPFGEREVVEWGGTEPLSVPRHTDVQDVRSYVRAPAGRRSARAGRGNRRPALPAERRSGSQGSGRGEAAQSHVHRRCGSARRARAHDARP